MKCPECTAKTSVAATRRPAVFGVKFLALLAESWPQLVCRRRHCSECSWRGSTVEMEVSDFHRLMVDVARQVRQELGP